MKKRLLALALAVAVTAAGSVVIDTAPAFAAQKDPHCRGKDQLIILSIDSPLEAQLADRDKDGYVCQSAKDGHYYNA